MKTPIQDSKPAETRYESDLNMYWGAAPKARSEEEPGDEPSGEESLENRVNAQPIGHCEPDSENDEKDLSLYNGTRIGFNAKLHELPNYRSPYAQEPRAGFCADVKSKKQDGASKYEPSIGFGAKLVDRKAEAEREIKRIQDEMGELVAKVEEACRKKKERGEAVEEVMIDGTEYYLRTLDIIDHPYRREPRIGFGADVSGNKARQYYGKSEYAREPRIGFGADVHKSHKDNDDYRATKIGFIKDK